MILVKCKRAACAAGQGRPGGLAYNYDLAAFYRSAGPGYLYSTPQVGPVGLSLRVSVL